MKSNVESVKRTTNRLDSTPILETGQAVCLVYHLEAAGGFRCLEHNMMDLINEMIITGQTVP